MSQNEFSVIDRYFKSIATHGPGVILGPGDDCAILTVPTGYELCVSTDTLIEGVHFPMNASARIAACRTLAANLSDLAAMGASPHSFLLALTLPRIDEAWLEEFSATLSELSIRYLIPLVGGNLSKGPLSMTMTVNGLVPAGAAITRHGALPGDEIYVTGCIGDAGQGLAMYGPSMNDQLDGLINPMLQRYCEPVPRIGPGQALMGVASAMIDISDGLLADLSHLAAASGVGAELTLEAVPVSDSLKAELGDAAQTFALTAGDDYELCFTANQERTAQITEIAQAVGVAMTRIGRITESGEVVTRKHGEVFELIHGGYQHF